MVDEKRIEELTRKRVEIGLSDEEADELGRLFAEQEGKTYSNAKLSKLPPGERGAEVPGLSPARRQAYAETYARQFEAESMEKRDKQLAKIAQLRVARTGRRSA